MIEHLDIVASPQLAKRSAVSLFTDERKLIERSIDHQSYSDLRDRVREDLAIAELERNRAQIEEVDVEGVLAFAEHVTGNSASLWTNASAPEKRALQSALFPEGLRWNRDGFGTPVTCRAFSYLRDVSTVPEGMASPPGFGASRVSATRPLGRGDSCPFPSSNRETGCV